MTTGPAAPSSATGLAGNDLPARTASARAGRQALGGRARQLLAQRLRPAAPLHRTPQDLRRGLSRPRRRHRDPACSPSGRLVPLPLGQPAAVTTHPLTYWRTP